MNHLLLVCSRARVGNLYITVDQVVPLVGVQTFRWTRFCLVTGPKAGGPHSSTNASPWARPLRGDTIMTSYHLSKSVRSKSLEIMGQIGGKNGRRKKNCLIPTVSFSKWRKKMDRLQNQIMHKKNSWKPVFICTVQPVNATSYQIKVRARCPSVCLFVESAKQNRFSRSGIYRINRWQPVITVVQGQKSWTWFRPSYQKALSKISRESAQDSWLKPSLAGICQRLRPYASAID